MEPSYANLSRLDFDPRAWVDAWTQPSQASGGAGGAEQADDADACLSTGIVRLQLAMQECDDRIEAAMASIAGALPRALRDLRQTAETAASIRTAMQSPAVSHSPPAAQKSRTQSGIQPLHHIQHLELLDGVKQRLDAVRDKLQTAAAWERLSREADAALDSRSVGRMAELLRAMRDTALALADLPGAESRTGTLADIDRQFNDTVVPVLQVGRRRQAAKTEEKEMRLKRRTF
jgi:hypothetical protein